MEFAKMQALGNDFVILDRRSASFETPSAEAIRRLCDRRLGIGCDQLIIAEAATGADASARFFNADGSEGGACGNGTQALGAFLVPNSFPHWTGRSGGLLRMGERGSAARIETPAGVASVWRGAEGLNLALPPPKLGWEGVPLASEMETLELPAHRSVASIGGPSAVGFGNPHCVFFVEDINAVKVDVVGPIVECDRLFPQRTNVEFVQVKSKDELRMRVWERGSGVTPCCGTGAAAALVAGVRRGLLRRSALVRMDGGTLALNWRQRDGKVIISGPATMTFTGRISEELDL